MKTKKLLYLISLFCFIHLAASAQPQWALDTVITTGSFSSGIAITPDNSKLVVTNNTSPGTIKIISTSNYAITSISYPADGYPNGVAITPNGQTALVNTMHHTLYIDLTNNTLAGFFAAPCVGTTLYGIAANNTNAFYPDLSPGCTLDGLRTISTTPTGSSTFFQIPTSGVLYGIAVSGNSAVITGNIGPPVHVNLSTSGVQAISGLPDSYGVAMLNNGNEALICDGDSVKRVSLSSNAATNTIAYSSFNTSFQNIAITADDKYAFVMGGFEKLVISLADNTVIQSFSSGGTNVAVRSDGSKFYVTDSYNGTVRVYKKVLPTGTTDSKLHVPDITVFPNPSSGPITVSGPEKISNIELYNMLGEKMHSSFVNSAGEGSIMNLDVPTGVYFLMINTEKGFATKKIVIQK